MAIQDGHRQRVKNRFRKEGLENFEERYVLELLLFYCIPRKDTKELACQLLEHFGSIVGVLEATAEELEAVPGAGEGVATFLSLLSQVQRYYQDKKIQQQTQLLDTVEKCIEYLRPCFMGKRSEVVYVLCLDGKCKLLARKMVGEGSLNSVNVSVRKIIEIAISCGAHSVILAHNHPGGMALPTHDDVQATHHIADALAMAEIELADHIIFTEDNRVSLAQCGYYKRR